MKSEDCQLNALGIRDDIVPALVEDSFCPAPDTNLGTVHILRKHIFRFLDPSLRNYVPNY